MRVRARYRVGAGADANPNPNQFAILPFYVEKLSGGGEKMAVLRVLRVVRIFRVFKLMSKSKMAESLQMFVQTLQKSVDALKMLCVFFSLAVLIFASLLYYAEKDREDSPFVSIPVTFWWAVVTMTTGAPATRPNHAPPPLTPGGPRYDHHRRLAPEPCTPAPPATPHHDHSQLR